MKALEKVCTSIASGWWREFAWENYDDVIAKNDLHDDVASAFFPERHVCYMDRFTKGLRDGIVKKLTVTS